MGRIEEMSFLGEMTSLAVEGFRPKHPKLDNPTHPPATMGKEVVSQSTTH